MCVCVCVCVLTNVSHLYHSGLTWNFRPSSDLVTITRCFVCLTCLVCLLSSPKEDWLEPQFSSFPVTAAQTKDPGLEQSVLRHRG